MENNAPVPVKNKIAAWMLIGLGIAGAIAAIIFFIFNLIGLLTYPALTLFLL